MRINWSKDGGPRARVIDLNTGEHLALCVMADEETGEFEQLIYCQEDRRFASAVNGRLAVIEGKSRIKIELLSEDEEYFSPQHPVRYGNGSQGRKL